jgi:hypothetical protein
MNPVYQLTQPVSHQAQPAIKTCLLANPANQLAQTASQPGKPGNPPASENAKPASNSS